MPRGKSPGTNGVAVEILVHHWEVIKEDILIAVLHFFNNRRMLRPLNPTFIVLIPKKEALSMIDEYRPISCLSIMYKFISKILTNRMIASCTY